MVNVKKFLSYDRIYRFVVQIILNNYATNDIPEEPEKRKLGSIIILIE